MAHEIIWTDDAQENVRDIFDYLLDVHGDKVANQFADRVSRSVERLRNMPYLGRAHESFSAVRELLLPPHNLIAYVVVRQEVILLNVMDVRRKRR